MHRFRWILLAAALVVTACSGTDDVVDANGGSTTITTADTAETTEPPADPRRGSLDAARAAWADAEISTYAYDVQFSCECPESSSGPFQVTVVDGAVVSVRHLFGIEADHAGRTIEQVFDAIEASLDADHQVDVTYDAATGVPGRVFLDLEAMAVDGGDASEISNLRLLGGPFEELAAARALWDTVGIADYTLRYRITCFCPEVIRTVTVTGGEITDVVDEGDPFPGLPTFTVEGLFDEIEQALLAGAASVTATYDEATGVPLSHFIDEVENMADEEHGAEVEAFTPASG